MTKVYSMAALDERTKKKKQLRSMQFRQYILSTHIAKERRRCASILYSDRYGRKIWYFIWGGMPRRCTWMSSLNINELEVYIHVHVSAMGMNLRDRLQTRKLHSAVRFSAYFESMLTILMRCDVWSLYMYSHHVYMRSPLIYSFISAMESASFFFLPLRPLDRTRWA